MLIFCWPCAPLPTTELNMESNLCWECTKGETHLPWLRWAYMTSILKLYGHLPPIMKTIQVRRTRHAGHCWRNRDGLISDVLLWTPTYGRAKAGWPARTYIQQLCEDTWCSPEDLPREMNDREKWRERVRDIRDSGTTWWWWWWYIYMYIYFFKKKQEFFLSKRSEEVLLIFFRVFGNFKNA